MSDSHSHQEKKLNPEQERAVHFGTGPLLIIAGAGTGKTTVITERIKYLITENFAKPAEILALTFTEKAAREMEERVDKALPYGYTQMWISTFHSFCDRILKAEALNIGLNPGYRLLSDADATQLLRKHLFKMNLDYFRPLGNPTKFIGGMLQHFSRLKDEDISPTQYLSWANAKSQMPDAKNIEEEQLENKKYLELANAYEYYDQLKTREGFMDFGDLITKTLELFRTRPNILKNYQKQFAFILVDEFQDTNIAQNELVMLLAGKKQNITAVCDDDQCLPAFTQITTSEGKKAIKDVKAGELVLTGAGKGYISQAKVLHVQKTKKQARLIAFTTQTGKQLTTTDNHKLFCMIPGRKFGSNGYFYVYLMWREGLGWRLGMTDDIVQRLRLERSADKIVVIGSYKTVTEAKFFETVYSMQYQIPQYPFKPRKQMLLTDDWLTRLFQYFNTENNAQRLAKDIGIDLSAYHSCLGGVVRGNKIRVKVILKMCVRSHRTKWAKNRILSAPIIRHEVSLETSSRVAKENLEKSHIPTLKTKKGWRIRKVFSDLIEAGKFAKYISVIVGGMIEIKSDIGKRGRYTRSSLVIPAKNVFPGMHIPVHRGSEIIYEEIVDRSEKLADTTVYDLEIEKTHNFIAEDIVVHNSIYKFRGAAVSNVLSFRKNYPHSKLLVLTQNYRSTQNILDYSYTLIQHNNPDRLEVKENINKKLIAARKVQGNIPQFIHADRVENEAEEVARKIKNEKLKMKNGKEEYSWKDIAILVRANTHAEPFVRALSRQGIPYQFLGPGQLFRQSEVKELIAYLQLLSDVNDSVACFRVLSMEYFQFSPRDLSAITSFSKKYGVSLFEACEVVVEIKHIEKASLPLIGVETKYKLTSFVTMVHRHFRLLPKETAGQILYYFLSDTGLLKSVLEYKFPLDEKRAANIMKFFSKLKMYEAEHEDARVTTVLDWILLAMELGESPAASDTDWATNDAVNILTVHSSKGLEFPVVFLVNLVSQRFPTTERREQIPIPEELIKEELPEGDYHEEEERRLFYVGMTRARDHLFLTAANFYGEGKREKKLSPFIAETLGKDAITKTIETKIDQLSLLDWKKMETPVSLPLKSPPITYLSYSQIETFKLCPLHYKLRYLLKIPTPQTPALSFGTSMHVVLKSIYERVQKREEIDETTALSLLDTHWIKEGYGDAQYELKMKERGKKYIQEYFSKAFDKNVKPVLLEEKFTVPLGYKTFLKIGGKIDRVDILPDGKIEIIDYKTGRVPTKREVDTNLQLSMYAIAANSIKTPPFGKSPENILLTLYYFDSQEKITTTRTREQLETEKKRIIEIAKEIETSDFRCSSHQICVHCEYQLFCGIEA